MHIFMMTYLLSSEWLKLLKKERFDFDFLPRKKKKSGVGDHQTEEELHNQMFPPQGFFWSPLSSLSISNTVMDGLLALTPRLFERKVEIMLLLCKLFFKFFGNTQLRNPMLNVVRVSEKESSTYYLTLLHLFALFNFKGHHVINLLTRLSTKFSHWSGIH